MGRATPLARPIDLDGARKATQADVAARFHPLVAAGVSRLPSGNAVFHGLPFQLGSSSGSERWILVDAPVTIDLRSARGGGAGEGGGAGDGGAGRGGGADDG